MNLVTIDGAKMRSIRQIHEILADSLYFPCWYGKNFDALHDCLTDVDRETVIQLTSFGSLKNTVGYPADTLVKVLEDSSVENPYITIEITE
ncbi:MAG: barstar family protein [Oscillospiraceae bacterium]|nr:barstar family protein [Oscillospiraceae bacterium]